MCIIDVPGPPLNVAVCNVNRFGASLTWEPPEYDGGSEITAYIVELRDRASIKWDTGIITRPDELGATLNDVVENKEYIFRVRAENQAGLGKPSAATPAVKIRDPIGTCISLINALLNMEIEIVMLEKMTHHY